MMPKTRLGSAETTAVSNEKVARLGAAARRVACLAIAVGMMVLGSGAAAAAPGAALVVYGKADKRMQGVVFGEVERSLRAASWSLVAPFSEAETAVVAECLAKPTPWVCMKFVTNRKGIDRLIGLRVDIETVASTQSQLVITGALVHLASSAKLEQSRTCIACMDEEARTYAADIVKSLLADHALEANAAKLQIKSEPLGAEVMLDGRPAGLTNNVFITSPGEHTVEVRLAGFTSQTRKVTAEPGKTIDAAFTLRRQGEEPAPAPVEPKSGGAPLTPKIVMGVGVLTMVVAAGLYWKYDENQKTFSSDKAPGYEPHYTDWGVPMAIMAGAGAAIAIGGGVWWWKSNKSATPTIAATPSGVSVGVIGSF